MGEFRFNLSQGVDESAHGHPLGPRHSDTWIQKPAGPLYVFLMHSAKEFLSFAIVEPLAGRQ
jgi:hypothetical protein